ncbi:MAG: anti-sigma factor [Rhodospirillales bacterium]|nr:anti-sigma factor [Rhodospirillales bacterium]
MTHISSITENDIHAYVDGVLDKERCAAVASWLEAHPDAAERVQAYKDQKALIRDAFDAVFDEPVPIELTNEVLKSRGFRVAIPWPRIAAGLVLLMLGGISGWSVRDQWPERATMPAPIAGNALSAHAVYVSEVRHPVEVGVDQEKHLVAWLSKRLGKPLRAPGLAASGYGLVGGRLLPDNGQPAAQFMYEDVDGNRITVYVRRSLEARETAFKFTSQENASAFYWVDSGFSYALAGKLSREELLSIAEQVYKDLNQN